MLTLESLTKDFASRAVDQVSLDFHPGKVHALLGANGAGKSTLCKMIAGLIQPSHGTMRIQGRIYSPKSKRVAQQSGVQIVQQELNVLPTLSLSENLFLSKLPNRFGILNRRSMRQQAQRILCEFGLGTLSPDAQASELGVGQQQMLEIAANTWQTPHVLILDEPTAALSAGESEILFAKIRSWKEQGVAILYISHRLTEVQALADQISILKDGKLQGTWTRGQLDHSDIVAHMTDRTDRTDQTDQTDQTDPVMIVRQLDRPPRVKQVSFELRSGEILGLAGLVGSGRTELLRTLFGADRARGGELEFPIGHPRKPFSSPKQAVHNGVVMISEDRKADGLLLAESIALNIQLPSMNLARFGLWSRYRASDARKVAEDYKNRLGIRCDSVDQSVSTLSGGNQQKVVMAKWLHRDGQVFLLDEPTRGIDIAARESIYRVIDRLAQQGCAILLVSSDLEELTSQCNRIGVLSNGRWIDTFTGPNYDSQRIVQAMFAGYDGSDDSDDSDRSVL